MRVHISNRAHKCYPKEDSAATSEMLCFLKQNSRRHFQGAGNVILHSSYNHTSKENCISFTFYFLW